MKMKDKSIIKNLYREGIPGAEKVIINDEDYKVHREKKNRLEEALRKTFSKEQEELFEEFMELYMLMGGVEDTAAYRCGVAFGIRITAEAFLLYEE